MTTLANVPSATQEMTVAKLGTRGQMSRGGKTMQAYTIELAGETGRSVAPADQIERLLGHKPDSWLSDGDKTLVATKDGAFVGAVELVPLFT